MRVERKNGEGIVIETPFGDMRIHVKKKDINGRILMKIDVPHECNVYRVDQDGKPQNRNVPKREFINDKLAQENCS